MTLLADCNGAQVYHCAWADLIHVVDAAGGCDSVIVDSPYSERTHAGHDGAICDDMRRGISYSAFTPADVSAFVAEWSPRCRGWMVSITDHILAPVWSDAMEAAGRYTFSPLAYVAPGSRVRLSGDGPAQWSCWIVVGRPRNVAYSRWGSLPGAYVLPAGEGGAMPVVGGKPAWICEQLTLGYSRPGDLIVDPCCGSGTQLVAAIRHGRRAIGGDIDPTHAGLAAQWIANPNRRAPGIEREGGDGKQPSLFGAP